MYKVFFNYFYIDLGVNVKSNSIFNDCFFCKSCVFLIRVYRSFVAFISVTTDNFSAETLRQII